MIRLLSPKGAPEWLRPVLQSIERAIRENAGSGGGGSAAWGDITGTLSDQTDLDTALDGKAALSHSHAIADTTGLQTALDGKAASSHSHAIADTTGLQAALDAKLSSADYTAADVLTKLLTVDGAGSGLDADLLDGNSSAAFAKLASANIHTGALDAFVRPMSYAASPVFEFWDETINTRYAFFGHGGTNVLFENEVAGGNILFVTDGGNAYVDNNLVYHAGNFSPADYSGIPGARVSGRFYDNSEAGNNSGTGALTANQIILTPFSVASNFTIDQIGFAVSTAVAGNAKVVCYSSDANNAWPDAHEFTATAQSTGTTGAKMASQSFTFLAGVQYWLGIWADAAPTIRTVAAASTQNMGLTGSNATTYATGIQRTLAYGTAPDPWVFSASELANLGTFPSIRMRAA